MQVRQVVEIHIGDERHLRVRRGLGYDAGVREGEVRGREDGGLRILDVHVHHLRQIADAACDRDVALVFDGPRLGTKAHPVVSGGCVRAERHEEDLDAFFGEEPAELRELHVIADEHGDLSAISVKYLHRIPALHAPF